MTESVPGRGMPGWLRLVGAILLGVLVGMAVNLLLLMAGGAVLPRPVAGAADPTLAHLLLAFLAHAVGTLAGAYAAARAAGARAGVAALVVGAYFLLGGITATVMMRPPLWFAAVDLLLAYLPAAWLGHRLAVRARRA